MQRALQAHPHHLDLLHNLKTILDESHDDKGTEQVLRQIIQEEPTLYDHRLKLARFFDQLHATDQAEAVLREALTKFPENDQAWLALADFLKMRRGMEAAKLALRQAAMSSCPIPQNPFALAALYEAHKDLAEAKRVYEQLAKDYDKKPAGLDAQVKIAQLDFNAGHQAEAERRLSEVLRQNPRSAQGLILQGKMALVGRNGKDAVQAFRTVLRDQPELAHVQYLLGQAYLATGDSALARESFERSLALQPGLVDANLALATMESRSGQSHNARARLKAILTSHPDHRQAMELLFGLGLAAGEWSHAASLLNRLRQLEGETAAILMAEGKLYESRKDYAQAITAYERAATMAVDAQGPLVAVVQLDLQNKQPERARRRLENIIAAHPDHPFAHGLMGEVLTLLGRREQAMARFRDAIRINPRWLTPWLDAATLSMTQGQADDAVRTLREGLNANPASEELQMLLASVLASQNAVDEAIAAYDAVLHMNPRNIFSANNLAALLADHKQDAPSLERAFLLSREFEKDTPHPLFLDTLGWVRLKMGHLDDAVRLMRQAIAKAPDLPMLNYHLQLFRYLIPTRVPLGPEDVLLISVWKDEHLTREVLVRPDGLISFPLVGDVPAEGRTVEELRLELAKRLIKYIPAVNLTVAVIKPLSYKVYVVGRVAKPGEFLVGHYTDVLQALSLAGGLTPFAAENDIKVVRRVMGQQQTFPFRYGDMRKGIDLGQNIILQRGDVVMVP
ncbi:MAG: tetratricopeptide repeat protein [Nitrospira sp.]|nr:tetratricopeptide repeat protein [Nitrospira sp.]